MKDWTGNKRSAHAMIGSHVGALGVRQEHDYYATDPNALTSLLRMKELPKVVYECACGAGHLADVLVKHGHSVVATDLVSRGYGVGGVDFLKVEKLPEDCNCILTNPPYKFTMEFIEHSLELLPEGGEAIFLLNVNALSGKARYERFYKHGVLKEVFVFPRRIQCAKNGDFASQNGSAVNYAWFVFRKGYLGKTHVRWIA